MKEVDYLIVGQGLAGTVLAHRLLQANKTVLIVDDIAQQSASEVAAGLYNPVVFKRLVKSWKVDELLPNMDEFYTQIEQLLGEQLYFKKSIVRFFSEEQEKTLWLKKCAEDVGTYLNPTINESFMNTELWNGCGSSETIGSGNLNVALFIHASRNYFSQNNNLIDEVFDYKALQLEENGIVYKDILATKILFCEGHKTTENPYFSWLPFKLTKGEVITIHAPALKQLDKVINKGVFVLPIGNDLYKVGATYEWKDLSAEITETGKQELIDKLSKIVKVPYTIVEQRAGIRPTVNDRRPLIGLHPHYKNVGVFNGLGTKGVMLAPYFAQQFVDFLVSDKPLDDEVNILRLKKDIRILTDAQKKDARS
jgi:glycine oxidase